MQPCAVEAQAVEATGGNGAVEEHVEREGAVGRIGEEPGMENPRAGIDKRGACGSHHDAPGVPSHPS